MSQGLSLHSKSQFHRLADEDSLQWFLATNKFSGMNRIKEVFEEKGIKQTWLCEKLGKSYTQDNGYVQNRNQPRLEVLFDIATLLGVEPRDLISSNKISTDK